jgi:hypothetical protein
MNDTNYKYINMKKNDYKENKLYYYMQRCI